MTKKAVKSKTLQANTVGLIGGVGVLVANGGDLGAPDTAAAIGTIIITIINIVLRLFTKTGVRL